jgi:hypothetical protein
MEKKVLATVVFLVMSSAQPCRAQWHRQVMADAMSDKQYIVYELQTTGESETAGQLTFSCEKGEISRVLLRTSGGLPFRQATISGSYLRAGGSYMTDFRIRVGDDKPISLYGELTPNLLALDVKERKSRMAKWFAAGRLRFETFDGSNTGHILEFSLTIPMDFQKECGTLN